MKSMYTNSGEKVQLTGGSTDLGHGIIHLVIYSDGTKGWEHVEDLQE